MKWIYAVLILLFLSTIVTSVYWDRSGLKNFQKSNLTPLKKQETNAEEWLDSGTNAAVQLDSNSTNAQHWIRQGDTHLKNGNRVLALAAYDAAIQLDSNSTEAWIGRGDALSPENGASANASAWEDAVEAYDHAIELDPLNPEAWSGLGGVLHNIALWTEKMDDWRQYINVEKIFIDQQVNLNDPRSAAALSDHKNRTAALKRAPQTAADWIALGNRSALTPNREEQALEAYNHAIELDPNSTTAWIAKGELLINIGHGDNTYFDEAIKSFDKAIDIDPKKCSSWLGLYDALLAMNESEDARHVQNLIDGCSSYFDDIDLNDSRNAVALSEHVNRIAKDYQLF